MSWTPRERATVRALNRACSTLSIAGASLILLCGALAPETTRGKTHAFVKRLALSDLMFSFACALGDRGADGDAPTRACVAQGILIQTFGVAGALWAALVSRALMESLRAGRATGSARALDARAWTACALSAVAPLATHTYGDSMLGRCHVRRDGGVAAIVRFAAYYAPIWAAFCYNARCWRAIRRGMASVAALEATPGVDATARRAAARLRTFVRRLAWYPIAQVVTNVPGTALRVSTLAGRAKPALWLACAHVACKTSQGALHAIVFAASHPARRKMVIELATRLGAARVLPQTWGVGVEDAQTGGLGDLADDVDFASDDDDDDDEGDARAAGDGFVVLTRATMDDDDDDDGDAYVSPTRTAAVEMSAFIGAREKRSDDASS